MTESTFRRSAYVRLLDRVVRILAVRDHSEQELQRKLAASIMGKNGPEEIDATAEDYERVIAWCHEHGYLDDSRLVVRLIVSRGRKGYGPAHIRQELNQKGISREATEKAMCECDTDWCILACDQVTRKCGEPLPTVFSEKIKTQRFLLYRGYLMENIQDIWRNFTGWTHTGFYFPVKKTYLIPTFQLPTGRLTTRNGWQRYFVSLISG